MNPPVSNNFTLAFTILLIAYFYELTYVVKFLDPISDLTLPVLQFSQGEMWEEEVEGVRVRHRMASEHKGEGEEEGEEEEEGDEAAPLISAGGAFQVSCFHGLALY